MIINQFDIVKTKQTFEFDGNDYNHCLITFPCNNDCTESMFIVDALPCDSQGMNSPEGYVIGVPTHTDNFSHVTGNLNVDLDPSL